MTAEAILALVKKFWLPALIAVLIGALAIAASHYKGKAESEAERANKAEHSLNLANATIKDMQVRLRPVAADGSARDWRTCDWIEGISSVNTDEILQALQEDIRSSKTFELLNGGRFIKDAHIGDGLVSANFSVKMDLNQCGKQHVAGMAACVEGDQRKVVFETDRFKVNEAAQSASNNEETAFNGGLAFCGFPGAISHDGANPADGDKATAEPISSIASATGIATKTRLTDEMQELVVKAVRESDLFTSLQTAIAAQAASTVALQQAVNDVVGDAIRNALKPGGMIWTSFQSCRH